MSHYLVNHITRNRFCVQGQKDTTTLYTFEVRVARAYTRTVMNRFEETMKYATAYRIASDPDGSEIDYVVQHTKRSNRIVWGSTSSE